MKKGFTLIELLAVIILLAITSVIATIIVIDVINDARESANLSEAAIIVDSGRLYYAEAQFDDVKSEKIKQESNVYYDIEAINKPDNGEAYINENGNVAIAVLIDDRCYIKRYTDQYPSYVDTLECTLGFNADDTTAPTVAFSPSVESLYDNWYGSNLYVNVDIIDYGSGGKGYKRCISTETCDVSDEIYTSSMVITNTGSNYICVVGVDKKNNESEKLCQEFKIDNTKPSVTMSVSKISGTSLKIEATASDLESSIVQYEYTKDNGESWVTSFSNEYTYTSLPNGGYDLGVRVTNGAGMNETVFTSEYLLPANATVVSTKDEFINLMGKNFDGYLFLAGDIDLTGVTWNPISSFNGTLDGNGKTLTGLNSTKGGLINYGQGTVKNLKLVEPTVSYSSAAGILANHDNGNFNISNIEITGGSLTSTASYVGGLVGQVSYTAVIDNVISSADVTGLQYVGSIAGNVTGKLTLTNAHATGDVNATSMQYAGGLVGWHKGTITNCSATGNVTGNNSCMGGLVGYLDGSIIDSYAAGNVTGKENAGGLVGLISGSKSNITNSYATGNVTGTSNVGGLVGRGENMELITSSYATGNVIGTSNVGGLAGDLTSSVKKSYATGNVTLNGSGGYAGGLIGTIANYKSVENSYATGTVTASNTSATNVGGLIGIMYDSDRITNCYFSGNIDFTPNSSRGFIVGGGSYYVCKKGTGIYYVTNDSSASVESCVTKVTENSKNQATYSTFDFDTIWQISEGNSLPKLRD